MKYFQYLTKEKTGDNEELWVCEECRRLNNNLILEGKWRLIGKKETDQEACGECMHDTEQNLSENYKDDLPRIDGEEHQNRHNSL